MYENEAAPLRGTVTALGRVDDASRLPGSSAAASVVKAAADAPQEVHDGQDVLDFRKRRAGAAGRARARRRAARLLPRFRRVSPPGSAAHAARGSPSAGSARPGQREHYAES